MEKVLFVEIHSLDNERGCFASNKYVGDFFGVSDRGFAPPADIRGFGFTRAFLQRVLPDTGAVFRCQPDGLGFEVFCVGLRNPQELAFDALGNLFTVDNDTAGPDEPRLLHLVEGGDYGWRCSYQHTKNFGPWCEEDVWRRRLFG